MARTLLLIIAAMLLISTPSESSIFDESDCKNPSSSFDLASAIKANDKRVVACFNFQQELARKREAQLQLQLQMLEERIIALENRVKINR